MNTKNDGSQKGGADVACSALLAEGRCIRCGTYLIRNVEVGLCAHCEDKQSKNPLLFAAEPFIRMLAISDALPPQCRKPTDPLSRHTPGVWPTLGDLQVLISEIRKSANAEAEPLPPDGERGRHSKP